MDDGVEKVRVRCASVGVWRGGWDVSVCAT